jgi:ATP-dependent Clp protease ATP-binding subunit ClpX
MGFSSESDEQKSVKERPVNELLANIQPEDLMRFGLIPEFVGRLPVIATLQELDEDALVQILTGPKNALIKQYRRLFRMDRVKLRFEDDALRAIARQALKQKTGARGLRTILERIMLDFMYEIPGRKDVADITITADMITDFDEAPFPLTDTTAESA